MPLTFADGDARHGTTPGYSQHMQIGEEPCEACRKAKTEYDRNLRSAPAKTRRNRLHAKSQQRAFKRLKDIYPELYKAFYDEEKQRLFTEYNEPL
jgi:arginyl-tRNA--protein-N-Asp/Glu arginylyltransferase